MSTTAVSIVPASPAFSRMVLLTGASAALAPPRPVRSWLHTRHSGSPPLRTDELPSPSLNIDLDLLPITGRSDEARWRSLCGQWARKRRRFLRMRPRVACICSGEGVIANVTVDVIVVKGVVVKAVA
jgi:hypothetical protein